jgi:hypothetical protein
MISQATETEKLILRQLALLNNQRRVRHGWLKFALHDLEYNPKTQYKVHLVAAIYWVINVPVIAALYIALPDIWLQVGLFITLIYSIYSNFATDYGAMSAALAAMQEELLPEIPLEQSEHGSRRIESS